MTARDGASVVSRGSRRLPAWLVGTALGVLVTAVCFAVPFIVHWAWPGLDAGVLMLGNLFLDTLLGMGAVIGFLHWKWEL